jgi:tRNA nucleotidyltransferase (CCA-adding enzyme)
MTPPGPNLLARFLSRLERTEKQAVDAAVEAARRLNAGLFLVGGPVRDLILDRPSLDIDLAVEGDVEALGARVAAATGLRLVQHGRFGTATLRGDSFTVDFARTRRESYPRPGALPDVEPAAILDDLARRDFTMNAMALRLTAPAGELIDPFGGAADIEARLVRVLHEESFRDDATRMLRACRYATRFGFALEPSTLSLLRRDREFMDTVSGARLRRELELTFREDCAPEAALLARRLRVLQAVHPLLQIGIGVARRWRLALEGPRFADVAELGFGVVTACSNLDEAAQLASRLHLTRRQEQVVRGTVRLFAQLAKLDERGLSVSETVAILEREPPAAVWALGVKSSGRVARRCLEYLRTWRRVRPSLDGRDLQAMGLAAGPRIGEALARLRRARLDGEVTTADDERALVRREFAGERP